MAAKFELNQQSEFETAAKKAVKGAPEKFRKFQANQQTERQRMEEDDEVLPTPQIARNNSQGGGGRRAFMGRE